MNDVKVIRQIAQGNSNAFEKFYNHYVKLVFAVVYGITNNSHDAEDVCAEVFVTVWNKAESCKSENVKSWLCAIAKNHALTFVQKRNRTVAVEEFSFGSYQMEEGIANKSLINRAISTLSEEEKQTVLLFNAGYKHREIAQMTGEPLGTVTWRYNNAIKKMRKFMEEAKIEK